MAVTLDWFRNLSLPLTGVLQLAFLLPAGLHSASWIRASGPPPDSASCLPRARHRWNQAAASHSGPLLQPADFLSSLLAAGLLLTSFSLRLQRPSSVEALAIRPLALAAVWLGSYLWLT